MPFTHSVYLRVANKTYYTLSDEAEIDAMEELKELVECFRVLSPELISWTLANRNDIWEHNPRMKLSERARKTLRKIFAVGYQSICAYAIWRGRQPRKEMTGSGIFASAGEDDLLESENPNTTTPSNKTGLRMYQVVSGVSQISFGEEEAVSTKKPTTLPEVAKQRELS
ncbi:unnamed protein product [Cuscuta campestris]|uniref:DUF4057 domain-containing protein n=1 Tax=Cuscuta campestris TaxID=132261 RepID=A0A484M9J5_9ASTE|nr:unnamed protein product [Cuscuta campestris]